MITFPKESIDIKSVVLAVQLPDETPDGADIFVAGDFNAWSPANPQYRLERVSKRVARIALPLNFEDAEYKFTRGSWDSVECRTDGAEIANRLIVASASGESLDCEIDSWSDLSHAHHHLHPLHTLSGDIRKIEAFHSPQLSNFRDILVYRPPGYAKNPLARFPVIYMQDGQNLFDDVTAYGREWGVDETSEYLARDEKLEHIIVAINHMGRERLHEYCPWTDERCGSRGLGERYTRFLVQTLKPAIDAAYRTKPEPEHTAIVGSSLGGLITLYAGITRRDVFGFAAALSPSLHLAPGKAKKLAAMFSGAQSRFYLDYGELEFDGDRIRSKAGAADAEEIANLLSRRGASTRFILDPKGEHNETSWGRRIRDVLRWFHK